MHFAFGKYLAWFKRDYFCRAKWAPAPLCNCADNSSELPSWSWAMFWLYTVVAPCCGCICCATVLVPRATMLHAGWLWLCKQLFAALGWLCHKSWESTTKSNRDLCFYVAIYRYSCYLKHLSISRSSMQKRLTFNLHSTSCRKGGRGGVCQQLIS